MGDCIVLEERSLFLPFRDGSRIVLRLMAGNGDDAIPGWHAVVIDSDGQFIKEVDMALVVVCPPPFAGSLTEDEVNREADHEVNLGEVVTYH